jgi:AraC-like DNA-binding protein
MPSTRRSVSSLTLVVHAVTADDLLELRLEAPSLIFTIEWATARSRSDTLDRSNCLVAARGLTLEAGVASRIGVIALHPPVLAAVEREYASLGLDRKIFERWLRGRSLLPRTTWLHEILHRYVFERHALGNRDNLATQFLEIEIAKELYFLFRDREQGADRASIVQTPGAPVERALRYLEAHLYAEVSMSALARIAGASESTLLRQFHAEVGCTPAAYWRNRKLDEALIALRSGRSVAEVAARVGYDHPTAFGFAFRKRFGKPPSAFRPAGRIRAAP